LSIEKKVYIEPVFKLHRGYHCKELIPFPPSGYQFVTAHENSDRAFHWLSGKMLSAEILETLSSRIPLFLWKSEVDKFCRSRPSEADLTFSCHHLILREEPWVLETGRIWDVISYNLKHFWKFKPLLETVFASDSCKKVLCFTEFSKETCKRVLDCTGFKEKIDVLPRAVHAKKFIRRNNSNRVRLLFVGSGNLVGEFEYRGGKEVLEVFQRLSRSYNNVELTIRSDIPSHVAGVYSKILGDPRVKVINRILSENELKMMYESSDIFFFPSHYESWQITLEAMSYELPVVSIGLEGVPEFVEHGKTGFLVEESRNIPCFQDGLPLPTLSPVVKKAVAKPPDERLVQDLLEPLELLIEDKDLRASMGARARYEVEHGRHSIAHRNTKLKQVFDEATS